MSEALAAWNGYVFDRPRSGRLEHQRVEHSRRLAHGQRDLGCGERCALGDHAKAATRRPFVVLYRSALHQGTAPGYQHHECQDCDRTPQESYPRDVVQGVQGARGFGIINFDLQHRRQPRHATRRRPRSFRPTPYLDPHERASENAAQRTGGGSCNHGTRPVALGVLR